MYKDLTTSLRALDCRLFATRRSYQHSSRAADELAAGDSVAKYGLYKKCAQPVDRNPYNAVTIHPQCAQHQSRSVRFRQQPTVIRQFLHTIPRPKSLSMHKQIARFLSVELALSPLSTAPITIITI